MLRKSFTFVIPNLLDSFAGGFLGDNIKRETMQHKKFAKVEKQMK